MNRKHGYAVRDVFDFHVEALAVLDQPVVVFFAVAGVWDYEEFLGLEAVEDEVVYYPAVFVAHDCVLCIV